MPLPPAEVHLWLFVGPEDAGPAHAERCAALLSSDETVRMQRYRFPSDRLRYLFAHALVRTTLSHYLPSTPPAGWRFVANRHGRPEIAPGMAEIPLRFSLSHTQGLVACAVALGRDVGVDVEHLQPPVFDLGVASQPFAPIEVRGLTAQPEGVRRERFFSLWTLKEAYIKARGLGLALPLDQFAFDLDRPAHEPPEGHGLRVQFDPRLDDDADRWHFEQLHPTALHILALAARRAPGESLTVSLQTRNPAVD